MKEKEPQPRSGAKLYPPKSITVATHVFHQLKFQQLPKTLPPVGIQYLDTWASGGILHENHNMTQWFFFSFQTYFTDAIFNISFH